MAREGKRVDMNKINIFIAGNPAPQGSKRHVGNGVMVESCKRVKPWRETIKFALRGADGQPVARFEGALVCILDFILPRPVSTPKKRTPAAVKKPDLDKLTRAVFDAVKDAGAINDDAQIVKMAARKRLANIGEVPGLKLLLYPLIISCQS